MTTYPPMVVHTDGTIFTAYLASSAEQNCLSGTSVVAVINPLTGQAIQTFTADPSGNQFAAFGNLIVAGDGYAYLPYAAVQGNSGMRTTYLNLLRMDTGGDASSIALGSWTTAATSATLPTSVNLITTADQGVLATWTVAVGTPTSGGSLSWNYGYYIATTSGTSVATSNATATSIYPVLQAQDGTFYGIDNNSGNMIKFDQLGNEQWSVPGDLPQIATADDGVVGASGITYDSNGNATWQDGGVPVLSWTGTAYQYPLEQFESLQIPVATTFWSLQQANPSTNAAAAKLGYSLVGPSSSKTTYNGTALKDCYGQPENPPHPVFYGYQECEAYTVNDNKTPPQQVKRGGINFDEDFRYRMDELKKLIDGNNWDLTLDITVRGITITAEALGSSSSDSQGQEPVRASAHDSKEVVLSLRTPYMTGSSVELLQTALVKEGLLAQANVDSIYGPLTAELVKRMQSNHELTADGIVGPATWALVDQLTA